MKVSGTATLHADRGAVWAALNDPAVLVRTIPGCQRLETVGADSYAMTLSAGVASIKGVYQGEVRISDQDEPSSFVLTASGAGAPGTVAARVDVALAAGDDSTTTVSYDADATVGGMIGGVGQRMLSRRREEDCRRVLRSRRRRTHRASGRPGRVGPARRGGADDGRRLRRVRGAWPAAVPACAAAASPRVPCCGALAALAGAARRAVGLPDDGAR